MPEGDTIARSARTLAGALVGRRVTAFVSPLFDVTAAAERLGIVGSTIEAIESRGKHLLIRFSAGAVLRTHLQMTGSWHLYRVGSRWQKPAHQARVILAAGNVVAVCFNAPQVEMLSAAEVEAHGALRRLGPDLLAPDADLDTALARLRAADDTEIGVALLDQSIAAGIGNVYKSEVLFLERIDPFARVRDLDGATLGRLLRTARRLLVRNLDTSRRRTTSSLARHPLWVYQRAGEPCSRCGTPIRRTLQGEHARATYWCPTCQPPVMPLPSQEDRPDIG